MRNDSLFHAAMISRQKGITLIGLALLLGVLTLFLWFIFTAFPLYNSYLGAKHIMKGVAKLPLEEVNTYSKVETAVVKRGIISNHELLSVADGSDDKNLVRLVRNKETDEYSLIIQYTKENKLYQNLYLRIKVKESIRLGVGEEKTVPLAWEEEE